MTSDPCTGIRFVATARRLAVEFPLAMLPCPICGDSLQAKALDAHLTAQHLVPPGGVVAQAWEPLSLKGEDRSLRSAAIAFPLLAVAALPAAILLGAPLEDYAPRLMLAVLLITLSLVAVYLSKIAPARITLDANTIRLRYGLGLFWCRLALSSKREVGSLEANFRGGELEPAAWERVGPYLRFVAGWSSITVGCVSFGGSASPWAATFKANRAKSASGLGRYWNSSAWREGGKRRRWDITLDPGAFAALQYGLVVRGVLSPRPNGPR